MFREESEGYAKLITELNEKELNESILQNIQSLIGKRISNLKSLSDAYNLLLGCFNLDPNRVLDIILESFENNPEMHQVYISLLKAYKSDGEIMCHILGFKFKSLYAANSNENGHNAGSNSLYLVTSYLLKNQIIDLELLLSHVNIDTFPPFIEAIFERICLKHFSSTQVMLTFKKVSKKSLKMRDNTRKS